MGLNHDGIIPLLVGAVKELKSEGDERYAALEARIDELERLIGG